MSLIALIAYFFSSNTQNIIPILGALALGAQRLLPILQQAYSAWLHRGAEASLGDIINLLEKKTHLLEEKNMLEDIEFSKKIEFSKVNFKYKENSKDIFKKIDLVILKVLE